MSELISSDSEEELVPLDEDDIAGLDTKEEDLEEEDAVVKEVRLRAGSRHGAASRLLPGARIQSCASLWPARCRPCVGGRHVEFPP